MKKRNVLLTLIFVSCAPKNSDSIESENPVAQDTNPVLEPVLSAEAGLQEQSFFYVWQRIGMSYPYSDMKGIDWNQAYWDLVPDAQQAQTADELRPIVGSLLSRLGESHFLVHPGASYEAISEDEGAKSRDKSGEIGMDVRLIEDEVLVVRIDSDSGAAKAGLELGDRIVGVGELEVASMMAELDQSMKNNPMIPHAVRGKVLNATKGTPATSVEVRWKDPDGEEHVVGVQRHIIQGKRVQVGNLPNLLVRYDERVLHTESGKKVGYVYFNIFLGDVVMRFGESMQRFVAENVDGVIIDLRGNPGGLGAMSRGIAGHFLFDASQSLGTMKTRDSALQFFVVPKAPSQRFEGPLVVLQDDQSASTSEILAGGLQDLGRATIVGNTSAGMALPSVIERMPNGDAIQFAMGDLVTASGYRIEGQGVKADVEVKLTPTNLSTGQDPYLRAGLNWIEEQP